MRKSSSLNFFITENYEKQSENPTEGIKLEMAYLLFNEILLGR